MRHELPAVGTAKLLDLLSSYVPDEFINQLLPRRQGVGRRSCFSSAQLWRVHVLSPLTGTHSYNGIVRRLPEVRAWRRFANFSHRERTPDVRMLHEFRSRAGVSGLREINNHLVEQLLQHLCVAQRSVALIDATDLPAATADKKKTVGNGLRGEPLWERVRLSRGIRGFLSATRNIRSVCGSTAMPRRFV
jgi:hypothetical protein